VDHEIVPSRPTRAASTPRVTVGMPVYNAAKWLGASIESILEQTWQDLELVISDNASTDGSFEIAQDYAKKDERIRVYRNRVNVGVNRNYSMLVAHARGEYFKWASSSDLCERTFIEKCVAVLDVYSDIGLCYPRTKLFVHDPERGDEYHVGVQTLDDDPLTRFRHVLEHIALNNAINGVIRMTVLRPTGLVRPHYSSDITLVAEVALRSKIFELPEVLFFRRFEQSTSTALQDPKRTRQFHFPTPSFGMLFQGWRRCWGYLSAVAHADLTLSQRLRAFGYVIKRIYSAHRELTADVKDAIVQLSGRRSVVDR
jgi:hypothetical protein